MKQLGAAVGKPLRAAFMTDDEIAVQGVNAQVWMRFMSDYVDVKELGTVIRLTAFEEFLEGEGNCEGNLSMRCFSATMVCSFYCIWVTEQLQGHTQT